MFSSWLSVVKFFQKKKKMKQNNKECDKKIIYRYGQVNMNAACNDQGQWYLAGEFCVCLEPFDIDLELYGVNENGWNGKATIDGNGRIIFNPDIMLDNNEFVFVGNTEDIPGVLSQTIRSRSGKSNNSVELEMRSRRIII